LSHFILNLSNVYLLIFVVIVIIIICIK